jgi:hypothetical protein
MGIPLSKVDERLCSPERYMRCPVCGDATKPYGGFGSNSSWHTVGKYACRGPGKCGLNWYGDPSTGEFFVRGEHGLVAASAEQAIRW